MGRVRLFAGVAIVCAVILLCLTAARPGKAAGADSWTSTSTVLELNKIRVLGNNELPPYSMNGNLDCSNQKVVTQPAKPPLQSEQRHTSCVVDAAYGAYSASGYLQRPGTGVSGTVTFTSGRSMSLIPVPRSNTAIRFGALGLNGSANLLFTKDFGNTLHSSADILGAVTHRAPADYTSALKDRSGQLLYAAYDSISFSANGQWMVADVPYIGTIRVDLNTFEVLPFGGAFNYTIGIAPGVQSAISPDGRYAVVASSSFGGFRLYDLSTCGVVPNHIVGSVNCQSRDLYSLMQSKVPGLKGIGTIRFINDDVLSLYASHSEGNAIKVEQFTLGLPGAATPNFDYLALGDSFASGEGAYQCKAITDTDNNKCHLSLRSYPYLLGSNLSLSKYESVACSGAVSDDITNKSDLYRGQNGGGIERRARNDEPIFSGFIPGDFAQHEFINHYKPLVITVSAIGNDIGFTDKLKRCLEPDTCYSSYEDRLEIVREINNKFNDIVNMYKDLRASGIPQAKIYAIGYPQLAVAGGSCGVNVHLNDQELDFSNILISYLNLVIKAAAAKAGVGYADVENALAGHRLCETFDSGIAVNGATAGDDVLGVIGNESYHPNSVGQGLLASAIQDQTSDFTIAMPQPDLSSAPPAESDPLPILQAPKTGRQIQRINYDSDPDNNIVYRGGVWNFVLNEVGFGLNPLSTVKAWLNSDPVHLGNFTVGADGKLAFSATIPSSVPTGFHMLHVTGTNVIGEPIDIYKTIYVAGSENDLDGDGIANAQDPCVSIEPAGIDYDQDGIDDACDGTIGPAPLIVKPEPPAAESTNTLQNIASPQQTGTLANSDKGEQQISLSSQSPASSVAVLFAQNPSLQLFQGQTLDRSFTATDSEQSPQVLGASSLATPTASDQSLTQAIPSKDDGIKAKQNHIYAFWLIFSILAIIGTFSITFYTRKHNKPTTP